MGCVVVQRYAPAVSYLRYGTQYLDNGAALSLPAGGTNIVLSESLFPSAGDYVIYDYTNGADYDGTNLDKVLVDTTGLKLSGDYSLENKPLERIVVLHLKSRNDNGTQFFDSDTQQLVIPGAPGMTVRLSDTLHKTDGTYILFQWPTAVNYSGNLADMHAVASAGRVITAQPFVDPLFPNQIRVTQA